MPFFQGTKDVVISGGEFNDVKGNLERNDTSEHIENYGSHNKDDYTEDDSNNDTSVRGSQAYATRRTAASPRTDSLPPYDNSNNYDIAALRTPPRCLFASVPARTSDAPAAPAGPAPRTAGADSRGAPTRANTLASEDSDNDRMEE